ncbi:hypothetical protein UP10_18705 [Bradyrhizobium sp. LTSPM299]|uniref:hypothetical protein n=1 Tax=Bradyrhizobium sp. LTSPM299 TaxID=1619233 RepID=UPI0005C8F99B|nr:hypothetical protein [Bradyrhizobium sp. LTSPM299]KJC59517.1 hypothetical protein UP10_18705 [Bradyrhizobium sp. LTSPM299]
MSFLVGLISLVVLAVVVPVVVRVSQRRNAIGIIVSAALIIHVAGVIVGASVLAELDYWQCASLYWFATVIMIYAYGTCYRSLSVQMLLVVARTGSRAIGVEPLYDQHFRGFISDRIDALVEGGRAEFRDGRIVITPRGRSGAELISRARRIFALRESRLYFTKVDPMETV